MTVIYKIMTAYVFQLLNRPRLYYVIISNFITYILNIDYLHCHGFISYQHSAAINCTNEIQFQNISDDVFADRMNTGLDWMWIEILTDMMDWIGLGQ